MNALQIEVKGINYQIGKLNAITQFHVSRRLAPILATVGISLSQLASGIGQDLSDFLPILGPVADLVSKMSDEDSAYVIFTALSVVRRQQGEGKFAAISTGQSLLFDDIDMTIMLRLVVEVLRHNLGNFMQGLGDATELPSS